MKSDFQAKFRTTSEREREVWRLIALGRTAREIAAQLGIAASTASNHRASLMQKMGARNSPDLTRMAVQAGIITVPAPKK